MQSLSLWGLTSSCLMVAIVVAGLRRVIRGEVDPVVRRVLVLGGVAKMLGGLARYVISVKVYGTGDAFRYLASGRDVALQLRTGEVPSYALDTGTASMEFLTGLLFAVTDSHILPGYVFFVAVSFVGSVLSLQAFSLAFPDGNRRLYAAIIMLMPTMMYWPSSLGKDAWLVFSLGLGMYGVARLVRRERYGFITVALGVSAAYLIRPHMGALLLVAAVVGSLVRFRDPDVESGAVSWLLGVALVSGGAGYALVNFVDDLLPQDQIAVTEQVQALREETADRTDGGGSRFSADVVRSWQDVPSALVTVPFRPFPWEVRGVLPLLSSLEGALLAFLSLRVVARATTVLRTILRRPYVAFAAAYTLGFVIAFSTVGNFGILARQRSQLLPLLAVLIAIPATSRSSSAARSESARAASG